MILTVTARVEKQCPYKHEVDLGSVTLTFNLKDGDGPELHDLAAQLQTYVGLPLSHEAFTRQVCDLTGASRAVSTWDTAGLEVTCDYHGDLR